MAVNWRLTILCCLIPAVAGYKLDVQEAEELPLSELQPQRPRESAAWESTGARVVYDGDKSSRVAVLRTAVRWSGR